MPLGLVSDTRVCQPTLAYDRKGPVTGADATGTHSSGTSLEDTTMVPTTSANVDCSTTSDQRNQVMLNRDPQSLIPQLAIWSISGRDTEARSFRRKLPHSCLSHGEPRPIDLTAQSLVNGVAGVVQGIQSPFQVL